VASILDLPSLRIWMANHFTRMAGCLTDTADGITRRGDLQQRHRHPRDERTAFVPGMTLRF
jgi:hypothetical protein